MTYTGHIGDDVKQYESLKLEEKRLKSKIEELGNAILVCMEQEGIDETSVLPMGGKITLNRKDSFSYSPAVDGLESLLKEQKNREQLDGTAQKTTTHFIKYIGNASE